MSEERRKPAIRFKGFTGDWERRKLWATCDDFEYGLNAAATAFDGTNKYIRITDIDDSSHQFKNDGLTSPDTDLSNADNYKLSYGDILFARTGASVGKTYIYRDSDGLVYYAGFLIRAKIKPEYDAEFIFQNTLTGEYDRFIRITSQRSGQPGVNAQEYGEYQFFIPSTDEQKRSGVFFAHLDTLITLHQRKYDKLVCIKKAMLEKMFPQNGSCFPEIRFAGFTDAWERRTLGELMLFQNGFNSGSAAYGSGIALISVMDILGNNYITYSMIRGKAQLKPDEAKRYSVEFGDVLFQRSSENFEDAGRSNVYLDTSNNAIFGGFVIRGKKIADYNPMFMKHLLDTTSIRLQVISKAQGAQHINVTQETLLDVQVYMPSISEQQIVGDYFFHLDRLTTLQQRALDKLKTLKKAFLEKMFV